MLRQPTPKAGKLVQTIVEGISLPGLHDFEKYLAGSGYFPKGVAEIELAIELHEKGWLLKEPNLADPRPVYLSLRAWQRFQLAEWSEVERMIEIEQSGPDFGSW